MRVASLGVARPVYYDRNPMTGNLGYAGANIAPHAETQRATATIAAGKKAFVDATSLSIIRNAAATSAGFAYGYANYTPSGGSAAVYLLLPQINNTVGSTGNISLGGSVALFSGDAVALYSGDASTGGTYGLYLYVRYVIFDA